MPTEQTNIEPGKILGGKVQGITTFGAFIELPDGEVGLVHISEIADTYVKDIKDFIREGDMVEVKVLSVAGKKIGLSIKQAAPPKVEKPRAATPQRQHTGNFQRNNPGGKFGASAPVTLDDKIAKFLKESDERMQPLKNRQEPKRRRST